MKLGWRRGQRKRPATPAGRTTGNGRGRDALVGSRRASRRARILSRLRKVEVVLLDWDVALFRSHGQHGRRTWAAWHERRG
jgi:hypothetical protein